MPMYKYIVKVLWNYKWLFLIMVIIPVVLTISYCLKATPLYESTMEIYPFCASNETDTLVNITIDTLEIDTIIYEPTKTSIFQEKHSLTINDLMKKKEHFHIFSKQFVYLGPYTTTYSGKKISDTEYKELTFENYVTSLPEDAKIDTVIYTMKKTIVNKIKYTPYYQINRIVKCNNFKNLLIDSKISPSLTSENYEQRIDFHETPDYTFTIAIRAENPQIADSLVIRFFNQLYMSVANLTSYKVATSPQICEEISWDYYSDQIYGNKLQINDSINPANKSQNDYILFDIFSGPSCSKTPVYPYNIFKTIVFVFVIASLLSVVFICIVEEIRQRIKKGTKS